MSNYQKYTTVVVGASAGGMKVIKELVTSLPADFPMALIIVQHVSDSSDGSWAELLDGYSKIEVREADEKESILPGTVYLAPANYHLLIESDHTFTLTVDERVNYARPSIDVLFETAADAYRESLIGIIYTGANFDGAKGLLRVKEAGGLTIVQDPVTAEAVAMPKAAIETTVPEYVLPPEEIIDLLKNLSLTANNPQPEKNSLT